MVNVLYREVLHDYSHVVDLLSETARQHLIGLVKHEHLHGVGLEEATLDHVVNTSWSSDNDLWTILKSLHVVTNGGSTNTCVALNVHEVTDGDNDLLNLLSQLTSWGKDEGLAALHIWVDLLEDGDREGGGLSGTRLSLSDNVVACENSLTKRLWLSKSL